MVAWLVAPKSKSVLLQSQRFGRSCFSFCADGLGQLLLGQAVLQIQGGERVSERTSEREGFLSELRVVLPLLVLPLKTPTEGGKGSFSCTKKGSGEPQKSRKIAPPSVPPTEALYDLGGGVDSRKKVRASFWTGP